LVCGQKTATGGLGILFLARLDSVEKDLIERHGKQEKMPEAIWQVVLIIWGSNNSKQ
jgi:hypothetical protein